MNAMKKTVLATALFMAMGAANAASVSTGGVFNMYSQDGLDTAGVLSGSEMAINVDSTISGFVNQSAGTWGVSSSALFYGLNWTASNGTLITGAGSYSLDTLTGAVTANGACGTGLMCFNVGAGQVAGAIDFAWGATTGIRVVNVWNVNGNGSLSAAAVPGMENGPFPGFNAAFNLTGAGLIAPSQVPVPAAAWLLGSGLLGLVGVARRKVAVA